MVGENFGNILLIAYGSLSLLNIDTLVASRWVLDILTSSLAL